MSIEITTATHETLSSIRQALEESYNTSQTLSSTVPFIGNNSASGVFSVILGGNTNTASGAYSVIAGGQNNNSNNQTNTFIFGSNITAESPNYTYVNNLSTNGIIETANGDSNTWSNTTVAVNLSSPTWNNTYSSWNAASATSIVEFNDTRFSNLSSQAYTLVDATSSIQPVRGTNTASGNYSNVGGGGGGNTASGNSSNVAGGTFNTACGNSSNVSGGWSNTASGCYSTVAGGYQNTASGVYSSVAGGSGNTACGVGSTVAGGIFNTASGSISNVAGGRDNTASGPYSNVAGGCQNTASGYYSSILGGLCNNTNNQANTFILGSNITALSANYTYVNNISSQGIVSANGGNSNQWNETYTTYTANSASYATLNYVDNNFFNLSGGTISGATRINNNLTVFGNLTATGTTTFANTIFSVTSSLSVVHIGSGPALYVGNNGDGDIASFYDIDQGIEILHVGGINSSFPNVGIKTSAPNKTLTVVGEISATSDITTTGTIEAAILRISSAPATFINPLTASNSFLVVNVNGVDKALQLWDFTS